MTTKTWSKRITAAWAKSIDSIFECGHLLIAAKAALKHGEFSKMIENELPFGRRYAEMFMKVASDPRLEKAKRASLLPPSLTTLYRLTSLSNAEFEARVADGTICPDMQRTDVPQIVTVGVVENESPPTRIIAARVEPATARAPATVYAKYATPLAEPISEIAIDDQAHRIIRALETLAGLTDTALDRVIEILCDSADDERLSRVREAIHAIGRLEAGLLKRAH